MAYLFNSIANLGEKAYFCGSLKKQENLNFIQLCLVKNGVMCFMAFF